MTVQRRNSEMFNLLRTDLQGRYEPQFALANAAATLQMLPELRGCWPFSSINESGQALDLSGQGRTLANTGAAPRAVEGLVPYAALDGATQFFSRADEAGLDLSAGFTAGGWFYCDAVAAQTVLSKYATAGNQRCWRIDLLATGAAQLAVSEDGIASVLIASAADAVAAETWTYLAGRFEPSVEMSIWVGAEKTARVAGVPASAFKVTAPFMVGGVNAAASLAGRAALVWLSAAPLPDAVIKNVYHQTRAMFGE